MKAFHSSSSVLILSTQLLAACGDSDPPKEPEGQAGASGQAGAGQAGSGPLFCPSESDSAVHYKTKDPNACNPNELICGDEQRGFFNLCGCGCIDKGSATCPAIDNPAVHFISQDPSQCPTDPPCALSQIPFYNSCGCGCLEPGV